MTGFLVTAIIGWTLFLSGEWLRRKKGWSNEVSRKLVHSIHGLLLAIWPFYIGFGWVIALELMLIIALFVARRLKLFAWMWKVGRKSWGDYLFPVGVIITALLTQSEWLFAIAILNLALADAIAALVGKILGKRAYAYKVFGNTKSIAGSAAFFLASVVITLSLLIVNPDPFATPIMLAAISLAVVLTAVENAGVFGWDNVTLPVTAIVLLNLLS